MKLKNILLLTLTALFFLPSVEAEEKKKLYKWVDERGNVFYSDEPQKGAEEVKLPDVPAIKMKMPKAIEPINSDGASSGYVNQDAYQSVLIKSPEPNGVIRNNAAEVSLSAEVKPGLKKDHQLRYFLDGKPIYTGTAMKAVAKEVEYGDHTASIIVVDKAGKTVIESKNVSFSLLHVINPNRRK